MWYRTSDGLSDIMKYLLTSLLGHSAPAILTRSNWRRMKVHRWATGKVAPLHGVKILGEEVRYTLENRRPSQDEMPISRAILIAGLVKVENVHALASEHVSPLEENTKRRLAQPNSKKGSPYQSHHHSINSKARPSSGVAEGDEGQKLPA